MESIFSWKPEHFDIYNKNENMFEASKPIEKEEPVKKQKTDDENINDKIVRIEDPWYDKYSGKFIHLDLNLKEIKNPLINEIDFNNSDSWSRDDVALFIRKFLIL